MLSKKEDIISSYLTENAAFKVYSVSDSKKGKIARTRYKVVEESQKLTMLEIDLLTGRKNQIRVHFSEKGHPVAGDKKYGNKRDGIKRLVLHSSSITIQHPYIKEKMTFEAKIPGYFFALINEA